MHFGTGPGHTDAIVDYDPYILDEHLSEIEICSRVSKSVFFLVSKLFRLFHQNSYPLSFGMNKVLKYWIIRIVNETGLTDLNPNKKVFVISSIAETNKTFTIYYILFELWFSYPSLRYKKTN